MGYSVDFEKLTALMDWMSASPVTELEWSDGTHHIKLVKDTGSPDLRSRAAITPEASEQAPPPVAGDLVTAPFFGIVHLSPAPDAPSYVSVGQEVKVGDTLCTIEAMKVFNAVVAEKSGILAEILVRPGAEVSVGQPLFRIEAG
jgi:acetyl-CoA carboxylase biotin carboxyl carrier protein